jgi:glycosyltransferase involved in cell wall biosynthesis
MDDLAARLRVEPVTVSAMQRDPGWHDVIALTAVVRLLMRERPQVVHTHAAKAGTLGRIAGLIYRRGSGRHVVLVHTFHGHSLTGYFSPRASAIYTAIERFLAGHTDKVIAVSEEVRDDLVGLGVAGPEKFEIIPYGFDLSELTVDGHARLERRTAFRDRLGIPRGAKVITLVARLVPIKRVDRFLRACVELLDLDDVVFLIAGDGELSETLERSSEAQALGDRLIWGGMRRDIPDVCFASDVVVLSSDQEGTPISLIEAAAAGLPTVSTRVAGAGLVIRDGDTGILVERDEGSGLARAIRTLVTDDELRERMGEAARTHALRTFPLERCVQNIDRLYSRLLGSPEEESPRLRVLQLLTCDGVGGTENSVCAQVLSSDSERVGYEVAILEPPGPIAARLRAGDVTVHSIGPSNWVARTARLRRLLNEREFDVVNAYGFKATLIARLLIRRPFRTSTRRPALVSGVRGLATTTVESTDSPRARAVAWVERLTRGLVDLWDANSPDAASFVERLGVSPDRVRYIPNGVDVYAWPRASREPAPDPPQILCVSRFVEVKRHVDLISALALLRDEGTAFEAHLVGDGPTRAEAERQVAALSLGGSVHFHGILDQAAVRDLMRTSSLFCLVSTTEGMPGAVLEAMATGLPVVGTDVNGTNTVVVDGVTGHLVPPRSPERLAAVLSECLASPELMREMGRAGRARIEAEFSLQRMIERKETLYAEAFELAR